MNKDFIKINLKRKVADAGFRVFEFKDNDFLVAYIPSINLSAYGKNKAELKEMLDESIHDYFLSLFELPEHKITEELKSYGWTRNSYFRKKFENNSYIDEKGILRDFNLPEDTKIEQVQITV